MEDVLDCELPSCPTLLLYSRDKVGLDNMFTCCNQYHSLQLHKLTRCCNDPAMSGSPKILNVSVLQVAHACL